MVLFSQNVCIYKLLNGGIICEIQEDSDFQAKNASIHMQSRSREADMGFDNASHMSAYGTQCVCLFFLKTLVRITFFFN